MAIWSLLRRRVGSVQELPAKAVGEPQAEGVRSAVEMNPVIAGDGTQEEKKEGPGSKDGSEQRSSSSAENVELGKIEEEQYPKTPVVLVIMLGIYLSCLLVALDRTIIATAIPRITDQFHSLNDVGWYGSSYLLTSSAFQLVFGRLYTYFNPKWIFLAAISIFEVGSAVCGAAPSSVAFILGRSIAGLGSAGIFSGSIILIVHTVPLHKRPLYTGTIGGVFGIASVAGPLLGGALTEGLSWRWCFYINLPIAGATIIVCAWLLKLPPGAHFGSDLSLWEIFLRLDPIGNCFFLPSIICLLLALEWGGTTYAWGNARIIALLVLFVVLLVVFIAYELWRPAIATVPTRIVKNRSILFGSIYGMFVGGSMVSMIYYLPIWFQAIKGASAVQSGIRNIPMLGGLVVTSVLAGVIITFIGYYTPFMYAGVIFMSVGAGLVTTFTARDTGAAEWIGYQILYGIGIGLGLQQANLAAQTVLPIKDVPTGSSVVFFAQSLGGSITVSIANNVFNNGLVNGLKKANIPGLDPDSVVNTGATDLRDVVDKKDLPRVLDAYNDALVNAFKVALVFACIAVIGALGMEWKSVKKGKQPHPTANENGVVVPQDEEQPSPKSPERKSNDEKKDDIGPV